MYIPQKSSPHTGGYTLHNHWSCFAVALLGWNLSWHLWKSFFCCLSWLPIPPLNIYNKRPCKLKYFFIPWRIKNPKTQTQTLKKKNNKHQNPNQTKKAPSTRYKTYSLRVFTTFDREGPLSESISKMQGLKRTQVLSTVFYSSLKNMLYRNSLWGDLNKTRSRPQSSASTANWHS